MDTHLTNPRRLNDAKKNIEHAMLDIETIHDLKSLRTYFDDAYCKKQNELNPGSVTNSNTPAETDSTNAAAAVAEPIRKTATVSTNAATSTESTTNAASTTSTEFTTMNDDDVHNCFFRYSS